MDAHDIFIKLSNGAKFNKKSYLNNKICKIDTKTTGTIVNIKNEKDIDSSASNEEKPQSKLLINSNEQCELTLLGDIKSENCNENGNTKSKKSKKKVSANTVDNIEQESVNRFRNINGISVTGKNVPKPIETFEQLLNGEHNVLPQLIDNIKSCGYSSPTPIQMQAIPAMLSGRQLLACAPTGSGKTAAFLVPIINQLRSPNRNGFRALIVCPTRELARQIFRECNQLAEGTGLCSYLISKISQKHVALGANLGKKYDILITTPNRLVYLLKQETPIDLRTVEWLIVDESDKLFEVGIRGFREQLADIYRQCDAVNLKRAMFSATHTHHVAKWCRRNLKGLVSVTIGHRNTATSLIEQKFVFVGNEHGKLIAFRNMIHEGLQPPVLVFVQSKERARSLFSELIYDGINVDVIHADRTQLQRDNVVRALREGKIWVLICTELMGRGIDFKGVNLVVNYDLPQSAISYIHRVGRTGRAGRPGKAVTFFTDADKPILRSIARVMKDSGCDVPEYMLGMQKPSKKMKRKLENTVPKREQISTTPRFLLEKRKKLKQIKSKQKKIHDKSVTSKRKL